SGTAEQPGGRVVLAENEMGIGFAALQGDANRHLAERAAGERVSSGEGLRAEQHMNTEGTTLAHEAVEQQRGIMSNAVIACKELLKFVDDEEHAGHGVRRGRGSWIIRRCSGTKFGPG